MALVAGQKRPRGPMNGAYPAEDYQMGSIMRVEVGNFMTYGHCVFEPGPRLNLVLGPNGTGKSSLVCALCVGLAGAAKILGRQTDLSEFIKRGEDKGFTKVTLSTGDPEKPTTVTRHLTKRGLGGGMTTAWEINGDPKTKKEVENLCQEYHVQLDNLCQFLPQDRVQAFAAMGKKDLLVETEKALESSDLHKDHMTLISSRDALRSLETTVVNKNKKLEQLEQQNEELERDVRKINERNAILEEVGFMEKRVPWVKYIQESERYEEAKTRFQQAKDRKEALEAQFNVSKEPIEAKARAKTEATAELKRIRNQLTARDRQKVDLDDQLNGLDTNLENVSIKLKKAQRDSDKLSAAKAELREKIEAGTAKLAALPPAPDHSARIEEIGRLVQPKRSEEIALRGDRDDVRREAESMRQEMDRQADHLRVLDGARGRRLQALTRMNPKIVDIDRWVQENQRNFRAEVHGPFLCEVAVADQAHAGFLEQHVENRIWQTYVTQNQEDQSALQAHNRQYHLGMNIINYTGNPNQPIPHPKGDASQFANIGVTHTLDEVFEAKPVIKHALCDFSGINSAYVGTLRTENLVTNKKLLDSMPIDVLWTPKNQYVQSTSRYSSDVTTRVVQARAARLFAGGGPAGADEGRAGIQAEIAQLRERVETAEAEIHEIDGRIAGVHADIVALEEERRELTLAVQHSSNEANGLRIDLRARENALRELERKTDPLSLVPRMRADLARFTAQRKTLALELVGTLEAIVEMLPRLAAASLSTKQLTDQFKRMESQYRERTSEVASAQQVSDQCKQILLDNRKVLAEAKQEAFDSFDRDAADEALREEFDNLPKNLEELQDMITDRRNDAERVVCANVDALREFEERQGKINELRAGLVGETEQLETGQAQIEVLKEGWLPRLRELVATVSAKFQANFAAIGCTGEVELEETGEEYKDYAIRLLVSFRDGEKLHELTAHRQSGGERSVSTILYLISLQNVTKCPFRVVDEINQGMDPINERKVFQQLVKSACMSETPQCFLLTPKLLPELEYTPEVTILNIFNGPWIKDVSNVFAQELLFRKRTRALPGPA